MSREAVFEINPPVRLMVTKEDIINIIEKETTDSGNYRTWCEGCNQVDNKDGLPKAEFLAEGGELEYAVRKPFEMNGKLEDIRYYTLTRERLVAAVEEWIRDTCTIWSLNGNVSEQMTPDEADSIVQRALFGYEVY